MGEKLLQSLPDEGELGGGLSAGEEKGDILTDVLPVCTHDLCVGGELEMADGDARGLELEDGAAEVATRTLGETGGEAVWEGDGFLTGEVLQNGDYVECGRTGDADAEAAGSEGG